MTSLPRLYLGALVATRRRFDRSTRFGAWQAGPYRVPVDQAAYQKYANRIGLLDANRLLPPWFYVLAQRAILEALTDQRFPFPPTGMVHLGNRTEVERTLDWDTDLTLTLVVTYGSRTSAGHRIDLIARFRQSDTLIATNTMSAMVRCPDEKRGRRRAAKVPRRFPQSATIRFAADIGRRYARVSGDYNPIHLWPWSARLFGFPRPIAHGMYSAGRVAALLAEHGLSVDRLLDVTFLKPAFLPSKATLGYEHDGTATCFELVGDNGRLLLHGSGQ